jgi:hypothetical protein
VGAVVAAVLLGGASGLAMGVWGPKPPKAPDLRWPLARVFKAHGAKLMEQGEWASALSQLSTAASYDSRDRTLWGLLATARREKDNAAALVEARSTLEGGDLALTKITLAKFQRPSQQEPAYLGLRRALTERCRSELDQIERESTATQSAETLRALQLRLGDLEPACARQDVARLSELLRQALMESAESRSVRLAFRNGNARRALELARRCKKTDEICSELADDLPEFMDGLKRQDAMGPEELRSLLDDADEIAASSEYKSQIRGRGAARFMKKAATCKAKGDWACARLYSAFALELDPDNTAALTTADDARNAAKEVYMRAYSVKDSDPAEATRLFKRVLALTPADDEYHLKTLKRLNPDVRIDAWDEVVHGVPAESTDDPDDAL